MKALLSCLAACAFLSPFAADPRAPAALAGDSVGTVRGKALFPGDAPRRRKVDMGSDAACQKLHGDQPPRDESVIVSEQHELANVFVWISKGLEGKPFPPPAAPVVVEQHGCTYVPHVLGMQVGQKLVVRNVDPVTHNVHSFAKKNKALNQSQQAGGSDIEQTFDKEEVLVQLKCDIHGWMSTYVGVVPHPYFAVTKADGSFEIPGLPPGEYTLSARHEVFGTQKTTVKVTEGGTVESSFTFADDGK